MLNRVSVIPVLFCLALSTSVSVGIYPCSPILTASVKKLFHDPKISTGYDIYNPIARTSLLNPSSKIRCYGP